MTRFFLLLAPFALVASSAAPVPEHLLGPNIFGDAIGEAGDFSKLITPKWRPGENRARNETVDHAVTTDEIRDNDLFRAFQTMPNPKDRTGAYFLGGNEVFIRSAGERWGRDVECWKIVKDPDDPAKNVWFIRDADVYGMASLEVAWVCFAGFDYQLEFDYKGVNSLIVRVPNNRATPDITTPVGKSSEWTHFSCVFTKAKAHVSDAIMINRRGEGDVHVTNLRLRRVLPPLGKDSPAPKPKRDPSTIPPPEPQPARGPNLMPEGDFEGDEFPSPWKLPCDFSFYGMKWGALEVAQDPDDETNRVLKLYGTRSRKHAGLQAWRHPKLPAGKYKFSYRAKGGGHQLIAPHPPDVTTTKISFRATPNNLAFDGPPIGVSQDWQTFEIPITVTNDFSGIVLIITEVYPGQEEYLDDFHLEKIE